MISPVIHFNGNCLDAIKLYEDAFQSTDKQIDYYSDAPEDNSFDISTDMLGQVMHATITLCDTKFNMSDVTENVSKGDMVCFNVFVDSKDEVEHAYNVLRKDGVVIEELGAQFFAKAFTVIMDKFGVRWQIMYL